MPLSPRLWPCSWRSAAALRRGSDQRLEHQEQHSGERGPENESVKSNDIDNGALTGSDLKNGSVGSSDIDDGSLLAADFNAGELAAGPVGPAGPQGPAGYQGPGGVTNAVVRRTNTTIAASPNGDPVFETGAASCLPGERLVGGGAATTNAREGTSFVLLDEPAVGGTPADNGEVPDGWRATAFNGDETTSQTLRVHAVCASP